MTLKSKVGISNAPELGQAIDDAIAQVAHAGFTPKAVLAFATPSYPKQEIRALGSKLQAAFPGAQVAGGSVVGFLYNDVRHDSMYNARAVAVLALGGDASFGIAMGDGSLPAADNARQLAAKLAEKTGKTIGTVLFFGANVIFNDYDHRLVEALHAAMPGVRLTGCGLAGEFDLKNQPPSVAFVGTQGAELQAFAVGISSDVDAAVTFENGMTAIEPVGTLSKVDGKQWLEIDGKPAKDALVNAVAGPNGEAFLRSPLMYFVENFKTLAVNDGGMYLMRVPNFTPDGRVVSAWTPKQGEKLELVRIDRQACANAVRHSGAALKKAAGGECDLLLTFSCSLRGFTLGGEVANEDALLREYIRGRTHLGIIARGEIGPASGSGEVRATGWSYGVLAAGK